MLTIFIAIVCFLILVVFAFVFFNIRQKFALAAIKNPPKDLLQKPINFGYKTKWIAVKNDNILDVIRCLNLKKFDASTWKDGLNIAGNDQGFLKRIFVSPQVNGWILLVSQYFPPFHKKPQKRKLTFEEKVSQRSGQGSSFVCHFNPESQKETLALIEKLSLSLGEVYYFATHRVFEYHVWAKAREGKIIRAFAYLGSTGEQLINQGEPTPEEIELGFKSPWEPGTENQPSMQDYENLWFPDEDFVTRLAGKWSIDPTKLEEMELAPGLGVLGKIAWEERKFEV